MACARGLLFRLPHEQSHLESVHELGVHVVVVPADTECLREGSQNVRLADFLCFGIDHVVHVATGGVFHLVNDVTLSARTRTDTDDYLVSLTTCTRVSVVVAPNNEMYFVIPVIIRRCE